MTTMPRRRRGAMTSLAGREARWGYIFLSPWLIGFLAFTLIPMLATLVFSFTNVNLGQSEPLRYVGFANWQDMLRDPQTWAYLGVTLKFAAIQLPVAVLLPFLLAMLLNSKRLLAPGLFRVLFFMPYTIPFVAGVVIWQQMLNPTSGWIDQFLAFVGWLISPIPGLGGIATSLETAPNWLNWLNDPAFVYPALVIVGLWSVGGAMIVYLGGLQGIPTELYDAARIDGAGWWAQLRHVTLPMMSPVFLYTLVLAIVDVLQYFLAVYVLNSGTGEPGGQTFFFNLWVYKNFNTFHAMSYASTLAWLLFGITLVVTLGVFWSARRWVYYAGER